MVGAKRKGRVNVATVAIVGLLGLGALLFVLPPVATALTGDPQFIASRFGNVTSFFGGGGQLVDDSYGQRRLAYLYTDTAWHHHFLLGTGPGYYFPNVDPS